MNSESLKMLRWRYAIILRFGLRLYINMTLCYDLHSHSNASDGVLEPAELVKRAHSMGVNVLALTDHDVLDGIEEARNTAIPLGLVLVPGVEISVSWRRRVIHVIGLNIDVENSALLQGLTGLCEKRQWRTIELGKRLEKVGIMGAHKGAVGLSKGRIVSRTHFARYMVDQGYVRDFKAAFKRYLGQGKKAYVDCEWATLEEAVGWIIDAGGQAVIAHPARYKMGRGLFNEFLSIFKASGGCGIEVISSSHSQQEIMTMAGYAQQYELLASVGSDFHEPTGRWAELGRMAVLPSHCVPIWQGWEQAQRVRRA